MMTRPKAYGLGAAAAVAAALLMAAVVVPCYGQQAFLNNYQLDCNNHVHDSVTKGFVCNGKPSCTSYITYRAQPPYTSPAAVAYLLGVPGSASRIASMNNISSDMASIPVNTLLVVPVTCSCFNASYYQHNASYTIKVAGESYFSISNDTYQGLTTCHAMMSQNSKFYKNITTGMELIAPLRCACPTSNQSSLGTKYLLTYMVTWGDDISSIARRFGAKAEDLSNANELSSNLIFPFNPILVPLTTEPNTTNPASSLSTPAPPPEVVPVQDSGYSSKGKKWIYVGIGIGAGAFVLVVLLLLYSCRKRRSSPPAIPEVPPSHKKFDSEPPSGYNPLPVSTGSWSNSSDAINYGIESLAIYSYDSLVEATGNFGEENRIKGSSVYIGSFKGNEAAVKVMTGDVSNEIGLLMKINHSNIIRLSGFCVHECSTYLVYEFADNGSISDWLHDDGARCGKVLSWKQRVQIASDIADALNYLHNYTVPSYVHKNLTTRSILVDGEFRAKVSNFVLARPLQEEGDGENGMGMHLTAHAVGSHGYMAPEYVENGIITTKLDVYAFGVIILELLSGKQAVYAARGNGVEDSLLSEEVFRVLEGDNRKEKLVEFVDPAMGEMYPLDLALSMAELGKNCVVSDLNARPSISQVIMILSKILSASMEWDPSSEFSYTITKGK